MALAMYQDVMGRDRKVEDLLEEVGVRWSFVPAYPLASIDRKKSLQNQSRLIALQDDTVDIYAESFRRGDEFPPIVVCSQSGSHLTVVADGNHRCASADKAGRKYLPAYVIGEPTKLQFLSLTYRLNVEAHHGLQPTMNDRLAHAAHLVAVAGITKQAAAQVMGVPERRLSDYMGMREAEARLRKIGAPVPNRVNDLRRLASVKSDAALAALARSASSVPATVLGDLVTAVNKTRSDADAVSLVHDTVNREKEQRAGLPVASSIPSAYASLSQVCNRVSKLPTREMVDAMPVELKPVIRARVEDRAMALMEIADWLSTEA